MLFNLLQKAVLTSGILPVEEINAPEELFAPYQIGGFFLIGILNACLMILIAFKFFQAIQQCGYKGGDYFKWLKKKDNVYFTRILTLSMLSLLGFILLNMALSFINHPFIKYAGFFVYFIFLFVYFSTDIKELRKKSKVPFKFTKKALRLIISFGVLTVLLSVILILGVNLLAIPFKENLLANFRYGVLCLCPLAVPYLVLIANSVNKPIEKLINKKYYDALKLTLSKRPDLIKIGITGSYAKTTVKNVLTTMLSEKYSVLASPKSFNTPMGMVKTAKLLKDNHQVLICEMGARKSGDIKELSALINPNIAVITGVNHQHLESFVTIENIIRTKSEILKGDFKGKAFISSDSKYAVEIYEKASCEKYLAGLDNSNGALVFAKNVSVSENGTEFTLVYNGEEQRIKTKLLGEHNVSNIALAASVALSLGVTLKQIGLAVEKLEQVEHRLQLIQAENGVKVLDDGYNSNPDGIRCALKVLSSFSGKKYVVTPGIIELGILGFRFNYEAGRIIADVCDGVILIGRDGSLQIREGLLSKGYPTDKIIMVKDLNEAKEKLKDLLVSGDTVLFANDVMDIHIN